MTVGDEAVARAAEEVLGVPFCRSLGIELPERSRRRAVGMLPARADLGSRIGTVHPLALAAPAEAVTGFLARLAFGEDIDRGQVTLQLKAVEVRLRRRASGTLRSVAEVGDQETASWAAALQDSGRVDAVIDARVLDDQDREVAEVRATWAVRQRDPGSETPGSS